MSAWLLFLCIGGVALAGAIFGWVVIHVGNRDQTPPAPTARELFADFRTWADTGCESADEPPEPLAGGFDDLGALLREARLNGRRLYSVTVYSDGSCDYTLSESLVTHERT